MRVWIAIGLLLGGAVIAAAEAKTNFVVIFADDLAYADLGLYGAEGIDTPHLDQMANEGIRFTSFYSMANACSPARAALLTGSHPIRAGIPNVLGPHKRNGGRADGLHPNEVTLAEVLKAEGYATACFGKWHLGDIPEFMPLNQGFDEYYGIPYSNDMWPKHPTATGYPDLPVYNGTQVVEWNPDMDTLTTRFTEKAVDFIRRNRERPFFVYLPHPMPHVPLGASEKFRGKSERGLFGDVIMEIDWSAGQIIATLNELGLDENTMVVFTSDNGPWLSYGDHAGSAGPLREGKGTTWDGGHRVPGIVRWPGQIPAGQVVDTAVTAMDLYPTFAAIAGAALPADRAIDGKDILPVLRGETAESPHEFLYFYVQSEFQAIRQGPWKLHLPHVYRSIEGEPGSGGMPAPYVQKETPLALFNLESDIGEQRDVSGAHPDIVDRLQAAADAFIEEMKRDARPAGRKQIDLGASTGG
ncbi:MAG: sulfatase [Candidatus Hydrogenedentes bacterium]|nr:sulfatase [Candidatus Hydrogenedentota bacterium]